MNSMMRWPWTLAALGVGLATAADSAVKMTVTTSRGTRNPADLATQVNADPAWAEYRRFRATLPADLSAADHLRLAERAKGLKLEEVRYGHLRAAETLDPTDVSIQRGLGRKWIDGLWLDPSEAAQLSRQRKSAAASIRHWTQVASRLRGQLEKRSAGAVDAAEAELNLIRDPLAVEPIESALSPLSEGIAGRVVGWLDGLPHHAATRSLIRHAVFHDEEAIRERAAIALRKRPATHTLPTLIGMLEGPKQTVRWNRTLSRMIDPISVRGAVQQLDLNRVVVSSWHLQDQDFLVCDVPVISPVLAQRNFADAATNPDFSNGDLPIVSRVERESRQRRIVGEVEEAAARRRSRAHATLVRLTDQKIEPNPGLWLTFLEQAIDPLAGATSTTSSEITRVAMLHSPVAFQAAPPRGGGTGSCFSAGTPVWTMSGPKAIDKVDVAEPVLTLDVETNELVLKPVIRRTLLKHGAMVRISARGKDLLITPGHLLLEMSRGWIRADEVKPGMALRGMDGASVAVTDAAPAGDHDCYNLEVADHHNFFAGERFVLAHDIRPLQYLDVNPPGRPKK
jgi:hypothetical protein